MGVREGRIYRAEDRMREGRDPSAGPFRVSMIFLAKSIVTFSGQ